MVEQNIIFRFKFKSCIRAGIEWLTIHKINRKNNKIILLKFIN